MVTTLLRPHSIDGRIELHVLQYARGYGVFEMLNVDKRKRWDSSGVQKNEIVFKINRKIMKMPNELLKRQRHRKNPYYTDNVKLTFKFVKIPFCGTVNVFHLSIHKILIMEQTRKF